MRFFLLFFVAFSILIESSVIAQQRDPKIAYVYPAGGQRGTTFEVLLGGRQIARASDVLISGHGVHARILHGYTNMFIVNSDDGEVARLIYDSARKQVESNGTNSGTNIASQKPAEELRIIEKVKKNNETKTENESALPTPESVMNRFPYFDRLRNPTQDAVQLVYYEFFAPRIDRKPKETLGQGVMVEITIDSDAELGDHELRLLTKTGLSSPVRFMVGTIPEINEMEPNDSNDDPLASIEFWRRRNAPKTIRQMETLELPLVINGRIRAGDVDQFHFKAKAGQKIVIGVRARHLVPYLADAVPGWFQAAILLYDSNGKKMDDAASFRFEPDPILFFDVQKTGVYTLEIQDSIFRGRDDFIYRISIDESPIVSSIFPLGGRLGMSAGTDITGRNLSENVTVLETKEGETGIREKSFLGKTWLPYPIRYATDNLPEQFESEPNNNPKQATTITLPAIVNGRILEAADTDYFSFRGKKGERIVLDVAARSLNSPLDANLELLDATGKIVATNDDRADSSGLNLGLETHHADPYLNVELPADGVYTVRLFNTLHRGGLEFGYRLRISPPQEDFAVYCEPTSLTFSNKTQPLKIHIVRKDGFNGEIQLRLAKSGQAGFQIDNAKIPAGTEKFTAQLTMLQKYSGQPTQLVLESVAIINGKEKKHNVVAVDDWEQAFIYHHLVPAKSLTVVNPKSGVFRPTR
jgi:hypothetical protein